MRVWAGAVLVGVATASLSACAVDAPRTVYVTLPPGSAVSEAPSSDASSSSSSTPLTDAELVAMIPEEAWTEDFFGASAFAKFFASEYRHMVSTGDSGLFEALAAPGCTFCAGALGERDEIFAVGGSVMGGEIAIEEDFAAGGEVGDGTWRVSFGISIAEAKYLDADGAIYKTVPAKADRLSVLMRYKGDHWVVIDAGFE